MALRFTEKGLWDKRFFELCSVIANLSEDKSRKVGAVIVDENNAVKATGFNCFPVSIRKEISSRHERTNGEKYYWVEHAERNAIYSAARSGISLAGCRMYATLFPCADCVRALIQCGIVELNTYAKPENDLVFSRSFEVAAEMIKESNIRLRIFSESDKKMSTSEYGSDQI